MEYSRGFYKRQDEETIRRLAEQTSRPGPAPTPKSRAQLQALEMAANEIDAMAQNNLGIGGRQEDLVAMELNRIASSLRAYARQLERGASPHQNQPAKEGGAEP